MSDFIVTPPSVTSVAVAESTSRFPVRRVFCVGRNYAEHAREMGADPEREPPFFFTKPADAVVPANGVIPFPPLTSEFHHEVELVIAIGKEGHSLKSEVALGHVWGYAVGVDLTRRDLQAIAKKMSRPWDWSKGFDASAAIGELRPASRIGHPTNGRIWLSVNGEIRQQGDLADMIWPVADIVSYVSLGVSLKPGDLIFSGTPAGVGAMQPSDVISGGVDGVGTFTFEVGPFLSR
jgi:fumarylpyruvate hydrolase